MRYEYTVDRENSCTRLGLQLVGTQSSGRIPLSILAITPGGLIDVTNKWRLLGPGFVPILEPGDIILSANGSSKEQHGMEIVWIALREDRRVVLDILRQEHDPCDMRRLAAPPAPRVRHMDVDPLHVRFTHDSIKPYFRNGNSVDMTICNLLSGKVKISAFPPLEVSRDPIGKRYQG